MKILKGNKIAIVWGAETKLGQKLVELLLFHPAYVEVKVFVEKKLKLENEKLSQVVIKLSELKSTSELWVGHDLFLCKLMDFNESKSRKELYTHNLLLPVSIAKMGKWGKINQVLCLSILGAEPNATFYNQRILGSLESHVSKMDFWSVHFFQPSFLSEKRAVSPFRKYLIKSFSNFFNELFRGKLDDIKPMPPEVIAKSMVMAAQQLKKGVHYYKNIEFSKIEKQEEEFA